MGNIDVERSASCCNNAVMTSVDEIVRQYDGRMQKHHALFDLADPHDRARSATTLTDLYFTLMSASNPSLFIEAGARDASVSFRARGVLPNARIVAFEPSPYNLEHYRQHFDYAGSRIDYTPLALAEAAGELSFFIRKSVDGMELPLVIGQNSLLKRTAPNTIYEEAKVQVVRLDDYFAPDETEHCCLWVDVEGSTGRVLSGAERVLGQVQFVMVEVEDSPLWEDQWLSGRVLEFLSRFGLVPVARDFEWWPPQYNVVCIRDRLLMRPDLRSIIELFYSSLATARSPSVAPAPPPAPARPEKRPLWRRFRSRVGRALPPRLAAAISSLLGLR